MELQHNLQNGADDSQETPTLLLEPEAPAAKRGRKKKAPEGRAPSVAEMPPGEDKPQPLTLREFLAVVYIRLQQFSAAKSCALGLTELHGFLESEMENCPNVESPEHLHAGFYEIAEMLNGLLGREIHKLERELYHFQNARGIDFFEQDEVKALVRSAEAKVKRLDEHRRKGGA